MSIEKHFLGKYTLASTDLAFQLMYATPLTQRGLDQVIPVMGATSVGVNETWLAYETDTGIILQMGNLLYLSQMDEVGMIISTPDITSASRFKWADVDPAAPAEKTTLEILVPNRGWQPVRYGFEPNLPGYLVYPVEGNTNQDGAMNTLFARQTISPSLSVMQSAKSGIGADLRNVDFSDEDLSGVNLSGAYLTDALLDGTKITNAKLTGAFLMQASMRQTDLTGTDLTSACFDNSNIGNIVWGNGSVAAYASFKKCTAIGAKIGSSETANWSHVNLMGGDFTGAILDNIDLSSAQLAGVVLVGASLASANFESAILGGVVNTPAANLSNAYLSNVNLKKANCFGVTFSFATIYGALTNLSETATLEQADFAEAYLEGISLSGTMLRGCRLDGACLINVDFTSADLGPTNEGSTPTSLASCCLQGAIFTEAKLQAANFDGSIVAFDEGSFNVRYCDGSNGISPPPPDFIPMNHQATTGLDETTLQPNTICPNGNTLAANQALGNSLTSMLTASNPAASWAPANACPNFSA